MNKGQSLIELLVAMAVFILAISAIAFLIIDAYVSDRLGKELTQATFLAEEGLEQARGAGFSSLVSVSPEIIDKFTRTITVTNIDADRKQVISQVTWNLTNLRPEDVSLTTYLTNWGVSVGATTCASYCQSLAYSDGTCRQNAGKCAQNGETYESSGDTYCTGGASADTCCCAP